ncbi:hypothetical protein jhhlp_006544 [Lomentospora prolificans]|uniref:Extracellular membrane protein CFEM domain-containing protein n=1 Tax=Lomentospora prolificans TaxID=41688 RepID=A0A2N3N698_9PEZI|nr:hypothetical protein jhhlp_006544 [Lomentospora prolificans]
MHLTNVFLLAAVARVHADSRPSASHQRRALQSCEESHGPGSQQCGPPESGYCFNPSEEQSESLEACAANAGFNIPAASASLDDEDGGFTASTFSRKHRGGRNRNQTTPIRNNGTATIRPSGTGAAGIALPTGTGVGNVRGNGTISPVPVSQAQSDMRGVVFSLAIAVVVAVLLV